MILQALCQYYQRMRDNPDIVIAEPGFSCAKIHAEIVLDENGNLLQLNDLRVEKGKKLVPREMIVPQANKRSGQKAYEKPNFLWDSTAFVLQAEKDVDSKTKLKNENFVKLHHQIFEETNNPFLGVILLFYKKWNPDRVSSFDCWPDIAGGKVVFRQDGEREYLHEKDCLQKIWLNHHNQIKDRLQGICLVTGLQETIARIHPDIKNVRNAQPKGAAIVSFNDDAYESYGKKQNYNAPMGEHAAFAYTTALNYLLSFNSTQKIQVGDATTVFWTDRESPVEGMFGMILDPKDIEAEDSKDVRLFLEAVRDGKRPQGIDQDARFYILGISPNAARLAVRFWHVCSVGELEERIGQHFRDLQIIKSRPNDPEYPGIWRLLQATVSQKATDKSPKLLLAGTLMRCILLGISYPQVLQNEIINRIRTEQALKNKKGRPIENVTYIRVAILKAILVRKNRIYNRGMEVSMSLDKENKNTAYLLGRLFAVLEKAQQSAIPEAKATIKDRFWGTASSTPRIVFPQLLNLNNHHISKIKSENEGRAIFFEKLLGEILDDIKSKGFSAHFTLDEQGLFSIGYYHQKQDLYKKKENKKGEHFNG